MARRILDMTGVTDHLVMVEDLGSHGGILYGLACLGRKYVSCSLVCQRKSGSTTGS